MSATCNVFILGAGWWGWLRLETTGMNPGPPCTRLTCRVGLILGRRPRKEEMEDGGGVTRRNATVSQTLFGRDGVQVVPSRPS